MNRFLLLFLIIILCYELAFSKSINNNKFVNSLYIENINSNSTDYCNKRYIIVYRNILDNNNEFKLNENEDIIYSKNNIHNMKKNIKKRDKIYQDLKSKFPFSTFKFHLKHTQSNSNTFKNNDLENFIIKRESKLNNYKDTNESDIFSKTFIFVNDIDIMKEVYGNTKESFYMKRSEDRNFAFNKFIKSINSTDFPIEYIEEDYPVFTDDIPNSNYQNNLTNNEKLLLIKYSKNAVNETQQEDMKEKEIFGDNIEIQKKNLGWGLDRIDQRQTTGDNVYKYQKQAGKNVVVYILDTGLNFNHKDYRSRAFHGSNFINDEDDNDYY
eukprot:jgi/Orpsp1_1/1180738/evm.model.c7180000074490.1